MNLEEKLALPLHLLMLLVVVFSVRTEHRAKINLIMQEEGLLHRPSLGLDADENNFVLF